PTARTLAVLGAQLCLESGNFERAHCFNWGNWKLPQGWDGYYCQYECDEIFDQATAQRAQEFGPCQVSLWKGGPKWRVVLFPPHPWSSFCAFTDADEGAARYVELLALSARYVTAWHHAILGDPENFSRWLSARGYYTADVDTYTR